PERKVFDQLHLPLAIGCVRFVGEAVAMVVAQTPAAAREGAEAVVIEYEVLPAVTDVMGALPDRAPTILAGAPRQLPLCFARPAVEPAIAGAHLVADATIRNQRTASAFMEPRAAISSYDATAQRYTLISGCQGAHRLRHALAGCLKLPQERVHVICPDVGGA